MAGGYNKCIAVDSVNQLYENHVTKSLPSMLSIRYSFPLVEFNDGKIVIAICGHNGNSLINEC